MKSYQRRQKTPRGTVPAAPCLYCGGLHVPDLRLGRFGYCSPDCATHKHTPPRTTVHAWLDAGLFRATLDKRKT